MFYPLKFCRTYMHLCSTVRAFVSVAHGVWFNIQTDLKLTYRLRSWEKTLLKTDRERGFPPLCLSSDALLYKQHRILAVWITAAQTAPLRRFKDPPDKTSCHVNPRWNKYSNVLPDSNKNSHVYRDKKGCAILKKQLAQFPCMWKTVKKKFDWHFAILFHYNGICHIIIETAFKRD